jgi:hypothetical protein
MSLLSTEEMAKRYARRLELERKRGKKRREEREAEGLKAVTVWVPKDGTDQIKKFARLLNEGYEVSSAYVNPQNGQWKITSPTYKKQPPRSPAGRDVPVPPGPPDEE